MRTPSVLLTAVLFAFCGASASALAVDTPPATKTAPAKVTDAVKPAVGPASGVAAKADPRSTSGPIKVAAVGSQQNRMKECNKSATGKKGPERKAFMKSCLSTKKS